MCLTATTIGSQYPCGCPLPHLMAEKYGKHLDGLINGFHIGFYVEKGDNDIESHNLWMKALRYD